MTAFIKTDLFRNFLGGFALGAIALIAMQPQSSRAEIGLKVAGVYSTIQSQIS